MNIAEISFSLGFENPTYFSRLFKKAVGITPRFQKSGFELTQEYPKPTNVRFGCFTLRKYEVLFSNELGRDIPTSTKPL